MVLIKFSKYCLKINETFRTVIKNLSNSPFHSDLYKNSETLCSLQIHKHCFVDDASLNYVHNATKITD